MTRPVTINRSTISLSDRLLLAFFGKKLHLSAITDEFKLERISENILEEHCSARDVVLDTEVNTRVLGLYMQPTHVLLNFLLFPDPGRLRNLFIFLHLLVVSCVNEPINK